MRCRLGRDDRVLSILTAVSAPAQAQNTNYFIETNYVRIHERCNKTSRVIRNLDMVGRDRTRLVRTAAQ